MSKEAVPPDEFFVERRIQEIDESFTEAKKRGLIHHSLENRQLDGRVVTFNGKDHINFSTCSYLGLELDDRVKQAIATAAERYGASFIVSRTFASVGDFRILDIVLARKLERVDDKALPGIRQRGVIEQVQKKWAASDEYAQGGDRQLIYDARVGISRSSTWIQLHSYKTSEPPQQSQDAVVLLEADGQPIEDANPEQIPETAAVVPGEEPFEGPQCEEDGEGVNADIGNWKS